MEQKKKSNDYLSANDIFKDVNWHEEKLRHERTEYFGKELIFLYKKMLREKKEIRKIIGKLLKKRIKKIKRKYLLTKKENTELITIKEIKIRNQIMILQEDKKKEILNYES